MRSNYHTHSCYCDGKGQPREYVEFALANGFTALGFSGHAPLPFSNTFSIHSEDYLAYCNEVRALKEEYRGRIDILLGLEIDYVPRRLPSTHPTGRARLLHRRGASRHRPRRHPLAAQPPVRSRTAHLVHRRPAAGDLRRRPATSLPRRHTPRSHRLLPSNQRHDREPASHHRRPLQQDSHAQPRPLLLGARQMVSRPRL